ncbi:uncharacterized protein LOC106160313 [Lingula anatina]|uniref:Uncharacterized protein LOC106160313 n=1 Tax=Lingula anatina TaxID=7574 RepID=A0A1S3I226_LINAN|nr:uncharacterized protein LOC106160313 [Lingula anatina]|eukprot:XP_013392320.1 uncharacterized protein LOC106160313 [Lingula anatina]
MEATIQAVLELSIPPLRGKKYPPLPLRLCLSMQCHIRTLAFIILSLHFRKLVYQFETGTFPHNRNVKLLVNIEVPFSTIVGLHAHFSTIQVEVNRAPYIFPGYKLVTEGSSYQPFFHTRHINDHCDVTGGQFKTCPYHKITLKMNTALNFKKYLSGFDERLDGLFKKPFIELTGKTLPVVSGFGEGNNIYPGIDFSNPIEEPTKTPVMLTSQLEGSARCECTVSGAEGGICSTLSCGCLSLGKKCSDCQCIGCTNPLNILTQVGIGLQEIQDDPCLFQNLTKIQNLPQYLECNIHFPCCGCSAKLKYCIPSTVLCPNYPACKQAYKYSWCIGELCSEVDSPRNHCVECKYCRRTGDVHCQKCKRCYFSGPSGFRCPGCTETDLNSSSPNHLIDLFNAMVTDMKTWNSDTA